MEVLQRPAQVGRTAQVTKPDARQLSELLNEGPAIAGKGKRDFEVAALAIGPVRVMAGRLQIVGNDQLA